MNWITHLKPHRAAGCQCGVFTARLSPMTKLILMARMLVPASKRKGK